MLAVIRSMPSTSFKMGSSTNPIPICINLPQKPAKTISRCPKARRLEEIVVAEEGRPARPGQYEHQHSHHHSRQQQVKRLGGQSSPQQRADNGAGNGAKRSDRIMPDCGSPWRR